MKKQALHIITVFMAFLVLFSSMGYARYEHTCKITHKREVSLSVLKTCCVEKASKYESEFKKSKCCSLVKKYEKVNVNNFSLDSDNTNLLFLVNQQSLNLKLLVKVSEFINVSNTNSSNSPPLDRKLFLALIQSYII